MNIAGNTFLVSGGSSGLGEACARMVVGAGGNVILADINPHGETLALELGPTARYLHTDVLDETAVQKAIETAGQVFGGLQGVVNCAGIVLAERVLSKSGPHPLELFHHVVQVNLVGTFNVARLAAAAMAQNQPNAEGERGVIVNTASVAAFDGQIGQAAYAASKGGVAALTLPLARDLARVGIRVMAIAPGTFDTPMLASLSDAVRQSLAQQIPFPSRLGRPDEFASLVRHILENVMLNGEVIRLDGALRMGPR